VRDLKSQKSGRTKENRRKKTRQRRDWKRFFHLALRIAVFSGTCALMVSGGILAARMTSDLGYFSVDTLRVEGEKRVSREEILALSDIAPGTSIFDLDLEMIGSKIAGDPWIATAEVERSFPREVVIRVTERRPKAVINLGYLYYVDAGGEIFKVLEVNDSLDYPVITGIERSFLLEEPAAARQQLVNAVAVLGELEKRTRFNLDDVSELHYDPAEGLILYTYVGGVPIRIGHGNFAEKLDRLEQIYRDLAPRLLALKYIDLNVTDRVIVRLDTGRASG
jgi:cell division protein FtsQ